MSAFNMPIPATNEDNHTRIGLLAARDKKSSRWQVIGIKPYSRA